MPPKSNKNRSHATTLHRRLVISTAASMLVFGCANPTMTTQDDTPALPPPGPANELLATGDLLEIIYTRTNTRQAGPYRLEIGDLLSVDVADQPDISAKDVRVLPDGRISMRIIGSVPVAGRSVEQVSQAIRVGLERKNVPSPDVIVSVQSANQRLEQFLRSVAPENQGGRLQIRLTSDEQISLPLLASIQAAGRPLVQVRNEIVDGYRQLFGPQLNVIVNLREQSEAQVYVWGEVAKPGVQPLRNRMNAAMAVAAAGGLSEIGDQSQILVVRFRPEGGNYHWKINLTSIEAATQSAGFDVALRNRDIVYASRTRIGDVNQFVELYLRKNVPLPLGLGFTP